MKFVVDIEMLHLAAELAAAAAAKAELERQFSEQYPNMVLNVKDYNVDFTNIESFTLDISNFDVEYK